LGLQQQLRRERDGLRQDELFLFYRLHLLHLTLLHFHPDNLWLRDHQLVLHLDFPLDFPLNFPLNTGNRDACCSDCLAGLNNQLEDLCGVERLREYRTEQLESVLQQGSLQLPFVLLSPVFLLPPHLTIPLTQAVVPASPSPHSAPASPANSSDATSLLPPPPLPLRPPPSTCPFPSTRTSSVRTLTERSTTLAVRHSLLPLRPV
jgi:hypothetical protein